MPQFRFLRFWPAVLLVLILAGVTGTGQTTSFSYQGRLQDGGTPANGAYDFQFRLFDAPATVNQVGPTLFRDDVTVSNGTFTVSLDFGAAAFPGADRFLEIGVRPGASTGAFTSLGPLQQITPTPYALRAASAASADNTIQNGTTQQAGSNFNISGNGTAGGTLTGNIVSATTQYNIGANRVLATPGTFNLFVGPTTGPVNTGSFNTFVGAVTGRSNTTGQSNTFMGHNTGDHNLGGSQNSFVGAGAGFGNTSGNNNSFFGASAGLGNASGSNNSFFGQGAGFSGSGNSIFGQNAGTQTTGDSNSFFGQTAGMANTTGNGNSFFGQSSGLNNTQGAGNSYFGYFTGSANTTAINNAFFGLFTGNANTGDQNAFFGANSGVANSTGNLNSFFGAQSGIRNKDGVQNTFLGFWAGQNNLSGSANVFVGLNAGGANTFGGENVFVGSFAGQSTTDGAFNTLIGYLADAATGLGNATAIGANAKVTQNNSLVLGSINTLNGATADTNVGIGTTAPLSRLHIKADTTVSDLLRLETTKPSTHSYRIGPGAGGNFFSIYDDQAAATRLVIDYTNGNVGIGATSPGAKLEVNAGADFQVGPREAIRIDGPNSPADANSAQDLKWSFASAGSAGIRGYRGSNWDTYLQFLTNSVNQGSDSPQVRMTLDQAGNLGIGTAPSAKLHVNGVIRMDALGSQAGIFPLCWNASDQIASCSSSSLRYKSAVQSFTGGMQIVERLRPISFTWREGGMSDLGLAAEEVEKIEPRLTYRNKEGQVDGVRYNQLSAVFINAFKEQQAQIKRQEDDLERQREQIKQQAKVAQEQSKQLAIQQQQLDELKSLVCRSHRRATVCK